MVHGGNLNKNRCISECLEQATGALATSKINIIFACPQKGSHLPQWVALVQYTEGTSTKSTVAAVRGVKSFGQCKALPMLLAMMSQHEWQHS